MLNCYIFSFILIGLFIFTNAYGQALKERLVLNDNKDSFFINAESMQFDEEGNYCFEIKKDGKEYFYTEKDTFGPFKYIGGVYGVGGSMKHAYDKEDLTWYYKNERSTKVYGKVKGKIQRYMSSDTENNIALTVTYKDSVYYYINEKLVSKIHKDEADKFGIENYDWCSFSNNGKIIYYIKKDNIYHIYANDKLIDTSLSNYYQLRINKKGEYIFGEGRKPKVKGGKYDFMFFTHTIDTVLGPVRTVWNCHLNENGSYYYSGDDNGPEYIIVNNSIYKNINDISNITIIDKSNYMFTFKENGLYKINVNGKIIQLPFQNIYFPSLDNIGNFACYGL